MSGLKTALATVAVWPLPETHPRPQLRLITNTSDLEVRGPFLSVANRQYLEQMKMLREIQARDPWANPNPAPLRRHTFCE